MNPVETTLPTAVGRCQRDQRLGNLFLFGGPGTLGGAATKIRHLIVLLRPVFRITVVIDSLGWRKDKEVMSFLERHGAGCCYHKELPERLDGIALVICDVEIFASKRAEEIKRKGLKLIFSNEMMWEFKGEAEAVRAGLIDKVLFVSDFQAEKFAELYRDVPSAIPGNYVAPEEFEFCERANPTFTIGRLSRPDPHKYPEDFPVFYESLGLSDVRYRVMAWDEKLRQRYRWHHFGPEWELLPAKKERTSKFLQSLDLFVYPLGHLFKESWGRSTVEAMLTGCVPLVPAGHQFHNLLVDGESGFICKSFEDFRENALRLYRDGDTRRKMGRECARFAREVICDPEEHREIWTRALSV